MFGGRKKPPDNALLYALPPAGAAISSINSHSTISAKTKIARCRKGSIYSAQTQQQMTLCPSRNATNALANWCMDIAVANYIHSNMLLFSLTRDPKFLKMIDVAKTLGPRYNTPDQRQMSGPLLDTLYERICPSGGSIKYAQAEEVLAGDLD
jgi:hypothetical protein